MDCILNTWYNEFELLTDAAQIAERVMVVIHEVRVQGLPSVFLNFDKWSRSHDHQTRLQNRRVRTLVGLGF